MDSYPSLSTGLMRNLKTKKKTALILLSILQQACVSISIDQDSRKLSCTGLFYTEDKINHPLTAIDLTGTGIFYRPSSLTIGKISETQIFQTANKKCTTVIIAKNPKEIENIENILKETNTTLNNICIKPTGHEYEM